MVLFFLSLGKTVMMILSTDPPKRKEKKLKDLDAPQPEESQPVILPEPDQQTIEQEIILNEQEQDQALNRDDSEMHPKRDDFLD